MRKTARFSKDRKHRYALWRTWNEDKPTVLFIGLNPSTADETEDDPTIRRCINYAKDWGYGGMVMANLFAFRATDPKNMKASEDPVGKYNDTMIRTLASESKMVVACWGGHGAYLGRGHEVRLLISEKDVKCFGVTKNKSPKHPLYLKKDAELVSL